MLKAIAHRGRHATGVATAYGKDADRVSVFKRAVDVDQFLASGAWDAELSTMRRDRPVIFMGHTRHSTFADNAGKDEAAHPFHMRGVVGAHNGVVYNWRDIEKKLANKNEPSWMVDSQAIFAALARFKNPKHALEMIEGWFALSWVKDGVLHLTRASAPLACAYVPSMRTLFWNSEMGVLRQVLTKALGTNLKIDYWDVKAERVYAYEVKDFDEKATNATKMDMTLPKTRSFGSINTATPTRRRVQRGSSVAATSTGSVAGDKPKISAKQERAPQNVKELGEMVLAMRSDIRFLIAMVSRGHERLKDVEDVIEPLRAEVEHIYSVLNENGALEGTPQVHDQQELFEDWQRRIERDADWAPDDPDAPVPFSVTRVIEPEKKTEYRCEVCGTTNPARHSAHCPVTGGAVVIEAPVDVPVIPKANGQKLLTAGAQIEIVDGKTRTVTSIADLVDCEQCKHVGVRGKMLEVENGNYIHSTCVPI